MSISQEKFCTIPGLPEVRIAGTSGHIVIIGETPKVIPSIYVLEAKGKGCITEAELESLKARFAAAAGPVEVPVIIPPVVGNLLDDKNFPDLPGKSGAVDTGLDKERFDKIMFAVIELVNLGDPINFDKNGKPKVAALTEKCGFEVSGPERDAAFEAASK
jgi:hypothetical protein